MLGVCRAKPRRRTRPCVGQPRAYIFMAWTAIDADHASSVGMRGTSGFSLGWHGMLLFMVELKSRLVGHPLCHRRDTNRGRHGTP